MERGAHVLVLPYPVQGHINPMLQFAKRLASEGPRVTLLTTSCFSNSKQALKESSVNIEIISDGSGEDKSVESIMANLDNFRMVVSQSLSEIIEKLNCSIYPPNFLVCDCTMPWAPYVARERGLDGAPFFTQSCAANAIFYHVCRGTIGLPLEGPTVSLPSLPPLGTKDLTSYVYQTGPYTALLNLALAQFSNLQEANWIFFSTFKELEFEVVNWMERQWPIKTIGPCIPSMYLDKRLKDDKEYGINLFKPDVEACMKWLDTKDNGSVVYASFGSLATLEEEQMEEVACGLKNTNFYFLWVVRESEQKKLPNHFLEETREKGLVMSWCPQLDMLSHKALGCFMTHCGWNSTLEALSLGVPLVALPQWTDQTTNAKFIVDVWKVGVRIKLDEVGKATKKEIELCIREVMEGPRGKEMKENSIRWKELAIEAADEGGSSDTNIREFVAALVSSNVRASRSTKVKIKRPSSEPSLPMETGGNPLDINEVSMLDEKDLSSNRTATHGDDESAGTAFSSGENSGGYNMDE